MSPLTELLGVARDESMLNERFGIEVEAERMFEPEWVTWREHREVNTAPFQRAMREWKFVEDGSLRHRGIEFVSAPITAEQAEEQVPLIGNLLERGLVSPSTRTGVHVHVNVRYMDTERIAALFQTYALVEPLLFQVVGPERAQSIYCIPWWDGRNEPNRVAAAIRNARNEQWDRCLGRLENSCKYSALYAGPMYRYGTVEFRHAPTYDTTAGLLNWFRLVRDVSRLALVPEQIRMLPYLLSTALRPYNIDWPRYFADVEERGLATLARNFVPCTYKGTGWGSPASSVFKPQMREEPEDRYDIPSLLRSAARDEVRLVDPVTEEDIRMPRGSVPMTRGGMIDWPRIRHNRAREAAGLAPRVTTTEMWHAGGTAATETFTFSGLGIAVPTSQGGPDVMVDEAPELPPVEDTTDWAEPDYEPDYEEEE